MTQDTWTAVDQYISEKLVAPDEALDHALRTSEAAGLPPINVAPNQGKLLQLLAQVQRAERILEIGTLGGYSTIWLARALPAGGKIVTLELDPRHAAVARQNFEHAGLIDRIELRVGRAIDSLAALAAEAAGPFDMVFIDADKISTLDYFQRALAMSRAGTLIIVDNVIRKGAVADSHSVDASVMAIRRFNDAVAADRRVSATAIQTVGNKGYDGFAMVRVNG